MPASGKFFATVRTWATTVADGFLAITHNSFALLGLAVAFVALTLFARPDLRQAGEGQLRLWLQERQAVVAPAEAVADLSEPEALVASDRATATNPKSLPREQAAVAFWLSKKYRVAPEPIAALVSEAYLLGKSNKLDPTLILAIMAIESSFNPFAQSSVGAQGLMQVMTSVHTDKYESFGGHHAAFDPVTNLRVGVKVLKECIARAGSIEGGLRYYVGAANLPSDGGYAAKVLAEHQRLRSAAGLRATPILAANTNIKTATSVMTSAKSPAVAATPTAANTKSLAADDKSKTVHAVTTLSKADQVTVADSSL